MKILPKMGMVLFFTVACEGGGVNAPSPPQSRHSEEAMATDEVAGEAMKSPHEQLNPRSDAMDQSADASTNPSSGSADTTTPSNTGSGTSTTTSGGSTTPSTTSGTITGSGLPDILGGLPIPGMPCSFGKACASQADAIKHCLQKILIPSC